ncbi:hypothetical protein WISP_138817 [Willisornis vidua]|uniref:Uncharacterized protein n=1 Tax=Willisornis vidua TaxID=1566151 RepID=A0ABQ9CMK1_9PASS|nr:hypothetical protein WISP_138817 [Willisornis vidua]
MEKSNKGMKKTPPEYGYTPLEISTKDDPNNQELRVKRISGGEREAEELSVKSEEKSGQVPKWRGRKGWRQSKVNGTGGLRNGNSTRRM